MGFGTVVLVAAGSFVAGKLWRVFKNMKPQVPPNAHLLTAIKELKVLVIFFFFLISFVSFELIFVIDIFASAF